MTRTKNLLTAETVELLQDHPGIARPTDRTPTVSGTGEPGAQLQVTDQLGTVYPAVTVTAEGTWAVEPGAPLADGTYAVSAGARLGRRFSRWGVVARSMMPSVSGAMNEKVR